MSSGRERSQLLAILPRAVQGGQALQKVRQGNQRHMFDMFDTSASTALAEPAVATIILPDLPELPDVQRLAEEKKALGFYMSSHPLTRHAALLQALASHQIADLDAVGEKTEVVLGGMIVNFQVKNVQKSRSGLTRMAKLAFEDLSGSVPAMLWPEEFASNEALLKDDLICLRPGQDQPDARPGRAGHQQGHPARSRSRRTLEGDPRDPP